MAYDANILRRATDRLDADRRQRQERTERLREQAYQRQPKLLQLDRKLQGTMAQLVAATLRQGGDPVQAVRAIKADNLELQQERAVLLGALGLPGDALDDKPACPLCGDTGWQGAKMCQCLKKLCAQENALCLLPSSGLFLRLLRAPADLRPLPGPSDSFRLWLLVLCCICSLVCSPRVCHLFPRCFGFLYVLSRFDCAYIFSAMRSLALLARGFSSVSFSPGLIGLPVTLTMSAFLPHTQTGKSFGQVQGSALLLKISLTILSSSEWKVMMQSLPPGLRTSRNSSTALPSCPSSSLTSILIA